MRIVPSRGWLASLVIVASGGALLASCADPQEARSPEQIVGERAQAWADALMNKDLEAAYNFTSPGYREMTTKEYYHARVAGTVNWTAAEVTAVTCEQQLCEVKMTVTAYIPQVKRDISSARDYKWLHMDGDWWLYIPVSG